MNEGGFILIPRSIFDSVVFQNEKLWKVWGWCMKKAAFIQCEAIFQTGTSIESIHTDRGQFVFGRNKASDELMMDGNTIYKIMQKLQKLNHISLNSNNRFTIVTICNYDSLQDIKSYQQQQSNNRVTTEQQESNNRVTHIKNTKELKEIKEVNNKEEAKTPKFNFKTELISIGVDEQIASDWVQVRKTKKAASTKTAFDSIKKEIELSKQTPNECIKIAVEKSWAGFKSEWLKNIQPQLFGQQSASDRAIQRNEPRKTKEQIEMDELHKQFRK